MLPQLKIGKSDERDRLTGPFAAQRATHLLQGAPANPVNDTLELSGEQLSVISEQ
jgi:hypothetical protein